MNINIIIDHDVDYGLSKKIEEKVRKVIINEIRIGGILDSTPKLLDFQKEILEGIENNKESLILLPRGGSKTWLAAVNAIKYARRGLNVGVLAPSFRAANQVMKKVEEINGNKVLKGSSEWSSNFRGNKGKITSVPISEKIGGYNFDLIIVDSIENIDKTDWEIIKECWEEIYVQKLICFATHSSVYSYLYQIYKDFIYDNKYVYSIGYKELPKELYYENIVIEAKHNFSSDSFLNEFCGIFS